jgi:hypothetical protein
MKTAFLKLTLALLFLASNTAFAQKTQPVTYKAPAMPVNEESKLITYEGVVEEAGAKDELFKRAQNFFNGYYKNPTEVIKKQDQTTGELEGIHRFKIYNPEDTKTGIKSEAGMVSYTINLKVKEGKYKYEITKINWKQPSYYPIEKWQDKNSPNYTEKYEYYLMQVNDQMKEISSKLQETMKKGDAKKSSDW